MIFCVRKKRSKCLQSINTFSYNFVSYYSHSKRKQVKGKEMQRKREEKVAPRQKKNQNCIVSVLVQVVFIAHLNEVQDKFRPTI